MDRTLRAGQTWIERPEEVQSGRNAGSAPVRLLFTLLVPRDAEPSTTLPPEAGQPSVTATEIFAGAITEVDDAPSSFTVVHELLEFAPGAWTPPHSHGGRAISTVLEGEVILRRGGEEETLVEGDSWEDEPGELHAVGNATQRRASVAVSILLPRGAQPTTPPSAPAVTTPPVQIPRALPRTGDLAPLLPALLGAGATLLAAGVALRRTRRAR